MIVRYTPALQKSRPSGERMQLGYVPPTRRSMMQNGVAKFFGPHRCRRHPGFVHAFQPSSRGASKMRVMTNSCPADK
jgi:hypothetical protein